MKLEANDIMEILDNECEKVWQTLKQARNLRMSMEDSIAKESLKDAERLIKERLRALESFRKSVELVEEKISSE